MYVLYICAEAVTGFNVSQIDSTTYAIEWNLIASNALKWYIVIYNGSNKHSNESGSQTFNCSTNKARLYNLAKGIEYTFSIKAVYTIGNNTYTIITADKGKYNSQSNI